MTAQIDWSAKQPKEPGLYWHRNLQNAGGRAPIPARLMFVGYVNWTQDQVRGHGSSPTHYMPRVLRAVSRSHAMTADSLTVEEWGGEWAEHIEQTASAQAAGSTQTGERGAV